jgi:hypothetical protein
MTKYTEREGEGAVLWSLGLKAIGQLFQYRKAGKQERPVKAYRKL